MAITKRRASAKPSPTLSPDNPFRKAWGIAGVAFILILSVPMFIDAARGQSVDGSPLGTQTTALISALGSLGTQIDGLKNDIAALRTQLASGTSQGVAASTASLGEGIPDCLQTCRARLSACLTNQAPSPAAIVAVTTPLDACRNQANDCINRCRPRTTTSISCEDRCAVSLGGCVAGAAGDSSKLDDCRTQNRRCLIAACRPNTDAAAQYRIPLAVCREQCTRDLDICRKGAKLDSKQLQTCEETARSCMNAICTSAYESGPPTLTLPEPLPSKEATSTGRQ